MSKLSTLRSGALLALAGLLAAGCSISLDTGGNDGGRARAGSDAAEHTDTPQPGNTAAAPAADGAEEAGTAGAMVLVMDASGSMNAAAQGGGTLLDHAKQALHDVVAALPDGIQVGLRVYGHTVPNTEEQKQRGCQDTELIHPVGPLDRPALDTAIDSFDAQGWTPIGLSLQEAAADLPAEGPRSIILVSDGEDTCAPPPPCDVARQLAADGIDLVIQTVGFALGTNDRARQELECIAEAGGGTFHDVGTAAELTDTLTQVSERESRRYQVSGTALEGSPIPRDANTGQVNTAHTDRILGEEVNYYRFEIEPGSEVTGETIITGTPAAGDEDTLFCPNVYLTDEADAEYESNINGGSGTGGGPPGDTYIKYTDPVVIDADEVWIKVETGSCTGARGPSNSEFDLELRLTVEG